MLKLEKIEINNFKSIQKESIDFSKTSSLFMLGKNGSGKSNILEALSLINTKGGEKDSKYTYSIYANKKIDDEHDYIDIYFYFKNDNISKLLKDFKSNTISDKAIKALKIESFSKNIYMRKDDEDTSSEGTLYINYEISLSDEVLKSIRYTQIDQNNNGIIKTITNIKEVSEIEPSPSCLTFENTEDLEELIQKEIGEYLDKYIMEASIWKAGSEYMLPKSINLPEFASNPDINKILINLLKLSGVTKEDIPNKINQILKPNQRDKKFRFIKKLEKSLNSFVQSIWPDTSYKFIIEIDNNTLFFNINDDTDEDNLLELSSLSDGYRQFISLIVGLSLSIKSNKITNNLILIDEPEVHLYPKSIQYIRDEIIKLSSNNHIVLSTHSPYMIDHSKKEIYSIVKNNNMNTKISYFKDSDSLADNEVFRSAFGIEFISELIVGKILLVEGYGDQNTLCRAINKFKKGSDIKIIPCKGSNINSYIKFLTKFINPGSTKLIAIFDSDKEGRKYKKDNEKNNNIECFTLEDLLPELTSMSNSTIEDLYCKEYISAKLKEFKDDFKLVETKSVLDNTIRLFNNLDKREQNKYENVKDFQKQLKIKWSTDYTIKKADRFENIAKEILTKFN